MVNNADWLLKLNYIEMLRDVGACFSVNNMLRAKCYEQRMEKGLSFLEFNYMIMQSYDFYHLFQHYGCNMQFGGDDQWSNMLGGTELIRRKLGKDAHAMTITLLLNSEGCLLYTSPHDDFGVRHHGARGPVPGGRKTAGHHGGAVLWLHADRRLLRVPGGDHPVPKLYGRLRPGADRCHRGQLRGIPAVSYTHL